MSIIVRVLKLKCPKCGEGDLFCNKNVYKYKGFFDMPKECPVCKQDFQVEPGFYYGAMYASYGFTVAITITVYVAMQIFGFYSLFSFLVADTIVLLATLPYIIKVSRSFWLVLVVKPNLK